MADFIEKIKYKLKAGDVLRILIFINVFVFLALKVIGIFFTLFKIQSVELMQFLAVPSELKMLLSHFWTLISYMFVHENFWHLLFNLLWLYWFGQIFMQYFNGRDLGSLYVLGGLSGAILYVIAFNLIPLYVEDMGNGRMIGASAAVMAIVMAVAFYRPDVELNFFIFGHIKILYIAIAIFVLDFFSLDDLANPGGHIAHIGGALTGYFFAIQYKKGKYILSGIAKLIDGIANLFKRHSGKRKMKVTYHNRTESDQDYNYRKSQEQEVIDAILDKLKQSGYGSLSSEEKRQLFNASKK